MKNEKEMEEMFTLSQAEPSLMETAPVSASGLPLSQMWAIGSQCLGWKLVGSTLQDKDG